MRLEGGGHWADSTVVRIVPMVYCHGVVTPALVPVIRYTAMLSMPSHVFVYVHALVRTMYMSACMMRAGICISCARACLPAFVHVCVICGLRGCLTILAQVALFLPPTLYLGDLCWSSKSPKLVLPSGNLRCPLTVVSSQQDCCFAPLSVERYLFYFSDYWAVFTPPPPSHKAVWGIEKCSERLPRGVGFTVSLKSVDC